MSLTAFTMVGGNPLVTAANLASAAHRVNTPGDTRQGASGYGKRLGREVLVGAGIGSPMTLYIAQGNLATSAWAPVAGGAIVTPA